MQYAADKFERTQPAEFKRAPFALDEQLHPGAIEAIGWTVMAACFIGTCIGFLGL